MRTVNGTRPHGNAVDQLDYRPLSPTECLSTASTFSPSNSPIKTPTSRYSHGSFSLPGWHKLGSSSAHGYGPAPTADGLISYDESVEQLWNTPEVAYDKTDAFLYQQPTAQNLDVLRNSYSNRQALCLPQYVSNPCLTQARPIFNPPEAIPNPGPMHNILQWMPSAEHFPQQTLTSPEDSHQTPMTPHSRYSDLPVSDVLKTQAVSTPSRSRFAASFDTDLSARRTPRVLFNDHAGPQSRSVCQNGSPIRRQQQPCRKMTRRQLLKQGLTLEKLPPVIKQVQFKCSEPGCKGRFKRQEHLKRHMKSHSKDKPYVCWVPGCHRAFSRSDNLNAHYSKTHSKRGGRNRYVATLDETSGDYDPEFRGQLTPDGRPIYGSKL